MTEQSTGRGEWTRPGVFEVAPGVHRIPLPLPNDGLRAVNVYVLRGDDGLVLIDSGWAIPEARDVLVAGLSELGCTLTDVRRFLVTHVHRDHYQQAVTLRQELGMRVSLGEGERDSLESLRVPGRRPLQQQVNSLRALGADQLADFVEDHLKDARVDELEWALPDDWLTEGTLPVGARTLDVVSTPGHTRGHVVFHDLAGSLLFAGDHVLPTITPSIGFEPVMSPDPLGDFLGSLAKVRARPDAMLLPAHGPVTGSVHARVDELVAHHGARLDEVEKAVRAGGTTAFEVGSQLHWTRRQHALADLDPFNQMLAIAETAAHLELLVAQDRVRLVSGNGLRRYDAR
jgi:glyoxylase-like metal-dependent hydrolase (beta-lactamase superfamily II)